MGIHSTRLNWRRVGTEQDFFSDIESILHIASWVVFGKVHTLKVIVVLLHFKTIHDLVTHTDEDIFDFFTGSCEDVAVTSQQLDDLEGSHRYSHLLIELQLSFLPKLSSFFKAAVKTSRASLTCFPIIGRISAETSFIPLRISVSDPFLPRTETRKSCISFYFQQ